MTKENNEDYTVLVSIIKLEDENDIRVMRIDNEGYISLTELAKYKNPNELSDVIKKWLSNMTR